jgi:hydrogenase-4 transcriptional activator
MNAPMHIDEPGMHAEADPFGEPPLPELGTNTPDTIVGLGTGLRSVMELIQSVAPTDAPVLLLGETGSGKELAARTIHRHSLRSGATLVRVNCGAIPPGLVDSELFGHVRGSFTGAAATHRGWFEQADGGTLLLDEVAELSLDAQVRLLRVLQDGTLTRVGGEAPTRVDVRIIAATHRDLPRLVREGAFREDLWYRLSVFPIRIPPLRSRREDILGLAQHFAAAAGERLYSRPLTVSADEVVRLMEYDWPGNVRELGAVIERAAILGRGRGLRVDAALGQEWPDLVARASEGASEEPRRAANGSGAARAPELAEAPVEATSLGTLAEVNREHIRRVLEHTGGRIEGKGGAADVLGINPHTLRSRMRKLGIDWTRYRDDR